MPNLIGQTLLNQFRVESFIASGGMGAVYRVWDIKRNVPLAMKVLHADLLDDPLAFKSLQREARALQQLRHPNIVPFYGIYRVEDIAFLLEQYIGGPSLRDVLRKNPGGLPAPEALAYFKAIASALGYAHAHGIVHCDLKPANVMVDSGGQIYLADFGIARHADSATTTLAGAGTPAYMAPEQIRGEPVTPATDVYALGVLLYEMLTGQRPFRGDEPALLKTASTVGERIRHAHLHLAPPDPRRLNPAIPAALAQVVLKCLSKDPTGRYASMPLLLAAVESTGLPANAWVSMALDAEKPTQQHPTPARLPPHLAGDGAHVQRRKQNQLVLVGMFGLFLALGAGFVAFGFGQGGGPASFLTPNASARASLSPAVPDITSTPTLLPPPSFPTPTSTPTLTATAEPVGISIRSVPIAWQISQPESSTKTKSGQHFALGVGRDNRVYLMYFFEQGQTDLMHMATYQNGKWSLNQKLPYFNDGKRSGWFISMDISSEGRPHVLHEKHVSQALHYDTLTTAGDWEGYWVANRNTYVPDIRGTKLVLDANDTPHFTYVDKNKNLYYWNSLPSHTAAPVVVANISLLGKENASPIALALDASGRPYICYPFDKKLVCAHEKSLGKWENLNLSAPQGKSPAMVFDARGNLHLFYQQTGKNNLMYAVFSSQTQTWQKPVVIDESGDTGFYPFAAIDDQEIVHISYYDQSRHVIRYARFVIDENLFELSDVATGGPFSAIDTNLAGNAYIAYYDKNQETISLAIMR